jgi:hypothetical protein
VLGDGSALLLIGIQASDVSSGWFVT